MTTIPDDIMKAARDACEGYFPDPVTRETAARCAARAIAAERERCARAAENLPYRHRLPVDAITVALGIAGLIREGGQP